jgi:ABC-type polysaccharide/polyol phosphate transport system ATPase subunit
MNRLIPSDAVSATLREPTPTTQAPAGSVQPTVGVKHLSKSFRIPQEQYHTLKERALHPRGNRSFDAIQAVDDVTFEVVEGEFFGIVGRNGSGKSTLLKCLAGIYDIDAGDLEVHGRLSPFIELGVGFNPELTARDNVIINGVMLGLSRKQAYARFDDIVAFAELEEFMDLKLKNYSSGMHVRLAFSVAIQMDADILLIDEVLAVGDVAFQQKCFSEFVRLKQAGRTIVFVTHDMGSIERFCDRAMLLERGRIVDIGQPASIARQYNQLNFQRVREEARRTGAGPETLRSAPTAQVLSASFQSADGEPLVTADQGEPLYVRMEVRFCAEVEDPIFAVSLESETGVTAFATSTQLDGIDTGLWRLGQTAVVRLMLENWLRPGRYQLVVSVARAGRGLELLDLHAESSIIVLANRAGGGTVDLPHDFVIRRSELDQQH